MSRPQTITLSLIDRDIWSAALLLAILIIICAIGIVIWSKDGRH